MTIETGKRISNQYTRDKQDVHTVQEVVSQIVNRNNKVNFAEGVELTEYDTSGNAVSYKIYADERLSNLLYREDVTRNAAGTILRKDKYFYFNGNMYSHLVSIYSYGTYGATKVVTTEQLR